MLILDNFSLEFQLVFHLLSLVSCYLDDNTVVLKDFDQEKSIVLIFIEEVEDIEVDTRSLFRFFLYVGYQHQRYEP